jgi:hypothetical protein
MSRSRQGPHPGAGALGKKVGNHQNVGKQLAASKPKRRIGCKVTSAAIRIVVVAGVPRWHLILGGHGRTFNLR